MTLEQYLVLAKVGAIVAWALVIGWTLWQLYLLNKHGG